MGHASWPIPCLDHNRGKSMPGWCCGPGGQENRQCRAVPLCVEEAMYVRDQLVRDLHGAMGQVAATAVAGWRYT